jgi:hypothetical protein
MQAEMVDNFLILFVARQAVHGRGQRLVATTR